MGFMSNAGFRITMTSAMWRVGKLMMSFTMPLAWVMHGGESIYSFGGVCIGIVRRVERNMKSSLKKLLRWENLIKCFLRRITSVRSWRSRFVRAILTSSCSLVHHTHTHTAYFLGRAHTELLIWWSLVNFSREEIPREESHEYFSVGEMGKCCNSSGPHSEYSHQSPY